MLLGYIEWSKQLHDSKQILSAFTEETKPWKHRRLWCHMKTLHMSDISPRYHHETSPFKAQRRIRGFIQPQPDWSISACLPLTLDHIITQWSRSFWGLISSFPNAGWINKMQAFLRGTKWNVTNTRLRRHVLPNVTGEASVAVSCRDLPLYVLEDGHCGCDGHYSGFWRLQRGCWLSSWRLVTVLNIFFFFFFNDLATGA